MFRGAGVAWDELSLFIAPMVASLPGTIRVEEMQACGGRRGGRERHGHTLEGRGFWGWGVGEGIRGRILGEALNRIFIGFSQCVLSGSWSLLIGH